MHCSLPGSSVHGILQARILEWPFPSPGELSDPGIEPRSPALQTNSLPTTKEVLNCKRQITWSHVAARDAGKQVG